MAAVLFKIDWRLALDTLAVLPCILVVTFVFRHYVRDANRHIRTAIARINSFLQEYISGMSIVQIFNREQKARAEFARRNQENMVAWRSAILSYALFYPAVEILSVAAIALIYWSGGNRVLAGALSLGVLTEFTMFATRFFRPKSNFAVSGSVTVPSLIRAKTTGFSEMFPSASSPARL